VTGESRSNHFSAARSKNGMRGCLRLPAGRTLQNKDITIDLSPSKLACHTSFVAPFNACMVSIVIACAFFSPLITGFSEASPACYVCTVVCMRLYVRFCLCGGRAGIGDAVCICILAGCPANSAGN
jgi:hypothetical protein